MSWLVLAIINSAILGIVGIIDSHLLSKRLPSLASYLLPLAIFHLIAGIVILILQPLPANVGVLPLIAAFSTGITGGIGIVILSNIMRSGEVSRIIPVISTAPIFVALLAMPLLGETLNYRNWLGIVVTVSGAMVISIQKDTGDRKTKLQKSFLALIFVSILFAISMTASKYAMETISYWNMYSTYAIGLVIVLLVYSARSSTFKQVQELPGRNRTLALITFDQALFLAALILGNVAMQLGPVAIVSTIFGTRPAFVFLFALAAGHFFPGLISEQLSKRIVFTKFIAIAMIIGGVVLATL